ncbi:MAG: hypothetical protein U0R50_08575 [Gaiellales bacterium]
MRRKLMITGATVAVLATIGTGTALATGGDDEVRATGPEADRAASSALRITGGGTANVVERDGEKGATWEVEITKPDGTTVDVRLDAAYGLVVVEGDSDTGEPTDTPTAR